MFSLGSALEQMRSNTMQFLSPTSPAALPASRATAPPPTSIETTPVASVEPTKPTSTIKSTRRSGPTPSPSLSTSSTGTSANGASTPRPDQASRQPVHRPALSRLQQRLLYDSDSDSSLDLSFSSPGSSVDSPSWSVSRSASSASTSDYSDFDFARIAKGESSSSHSARTSASSRSRQSPGRGHLRSSIAVQRVLLRGSTSTSKRKSKSSQSTQSALADPIVFPRPPRSHVEVDLPVTPTDDDDDDDDEGQQGRYEELQRQRHEDEMKSFFASLRKASAGTPSLAPGLAASALPSHPKSSDASSDEPPPLPLAKHRQAPTSSRGSASKRGTGPASSSGSNSGSGSGSGSRTSSSPVMLSSFDSPGQSSVATMSAAASVSTGATSLPPSPTYRVGHASEGRSKEAAPQEGAHRARTEPRPNPQSSKTYHTDGTEAGAPLRSARRPAKPFPPHLEREAESLRDSAHQLLAEVQALQFELEKQDSDTDRIESVYKSSWALVDGLFWAAREVQ